MIWPSRFSIAFHQQVVMVHESNKKIVQSDGKYHPRNSIYKIRVPKKEEHVFKVQQAQKNTPLEN